jgi:F-type H+-transporting ATPase subunit delta
MGVIEQRYAQALADLAGGGAIEAGGLGRELDEAAATLDASAPLRAVLASPAVAWEKKRVLLDAVAERAHWSGLTRNFLLVAAQRGRASRVHGIATAFEQLLLERQGIVQAEVTSARALAPAERAAIEAGLVRRLGRQLQVQYRQDGELVGGFIARVGDQIFDGSIAGRLRRLRSALIANS